MIELLFLLGFTLHNLEEAVWLPAWSKYASKFHPVVKKDEFRFAVIGVTAIGYLLTFFHLTDNQNSALIEYLYYGFILMMCLNALFPHLVATVALKRYSPGLITGLSLNVPLGISLIRQGLLNGIVPLCLMIAALLLTVIMLILINLLFKIGGKIIEEY
jgi:hypothetical protein